MTFFKRFFLHSIFKYHFQSFLVAILFFSIGNLSGQSCCSATSASGGAQAGRCQVAVTGLSVAWTPILAYSSLNGNLTESQSNSWDLSLGWTAAHRLPFRPLQMYGTLPFRIQRRDLLDLKETAIGLGDVNVGFRWTALEDLTVGLLSDYPGAWTPFLDFDLSLISPTGRSVENSQTQTAADVMGLGVWSVNWGLTVNKFIYPQFAIGLSGGGNNSFSKNKSTVIPGQKFNGDLSLIWIKNLHWTYNIFSELSYQTESHLSGSALEGSEKQSLRIGLKTSYSFGGLRQELRVGLDSEPTTSTFRKGEGSWGPTVTGMYRHSKL